jgi:hypothetical protein
MDCI